MILSICTREIMKNKERKERERTKKARDLIFFSLVGNSNLIKISKANIFSTNAFMILLYMFIELNELKRGKKRKKQKNKKQKAKSVLYALFVYACMVCVVEVWWHKISEKRNLFSIK